MLSIEGLQSCCRTLAGKERSVVFAALLAEIMPIWMINTPQRQAMFIAQAMHESGEFRWLHELGSDKYLSYLDTGSIAKRLGNTPEADGDGQFYKARGIFGITGLDNYRKCGIALKLNLVEHPELLENPRHAVASACWFWFSKNLNKHADLNAITACSIAINGKNKQGTANGIEDRKEYWNRTKLIMGIA